MFLRLFGTFGPNAICPKPPRRTLSTKPAAMRTGRVGVLLVNLGGHPMSPRGAIRRYLGEFLSDPRVIEIPRYLWMPILHGLVLAICGPSRLAPRYAGIWMERGLAPAGLQPEAGRRGAPGPGRARECMPRWSWPCAMASRRSRRRSRLARARLRSHPGRAAVPAIRGQHHGHGGRCRDAPRGRLRDQPALRFVKRFHNDPAYVEAQAGRIAEFWSGPRPAPEAGHELSWAAALFDRTGRPYYRDCLDTARLLRERLGLREDEVEVTFQSRFGSARWLEPYTGAHPGGTGPAGRDRGRRGVSGVRTDCLETLGGNQPGMPRRLSWRPAAGSSATSRR